MNKKCGNEQQGCQAAIGPSREPMRLTEAGGNQKEDWAADEPFEEAHTADV
jgi:hypothetical protein